MRGSLKNLTIVFGFAARVAVGVVLHPSLIAIAEDSKPTAPATSPEAANTATAKPEASKEKTVAEDDSVRDLSVEEVRGLGIKDFGFLLSGNKLIVQGVAPKECADLLSIKTSNGSSDLFGDLDGDLSAAVPRSVKTIAGVRFVALDGYKKLKDCFSKWGNIIQNKKCESQLPEKLATRTGHATLECTYLNNDNIIDFGGEKKCVTPMVVTMPKTVNAVKAIQVSLAAVPMVDSNDQVVEKYVGKQCAADIRREQAAADRDARVTDARNLLEACIQAKDATGAQRALQLVAANHGFESAEEAKAFQARIKKNLFDSKLAELKKTLNKLDLDKETLDDDAIKTLKDEAVELAQKDDSYKAKIDSDILQPLRKKLMETVTAARLELALQVANAEHELEVGGESEKAANKLREYEYPLYKDKVLAQNYYAARGKLDSCLRQQQLGLNTFSLSFDPCSTIAAYTERAGEAWALAHDKTVTRLQTKYEAKCANYSSQNLTACSEIADYLKSAAQLPQVAETRYAQIAQAQQKRDLAQMQQRIQLLRQQGLAFPALNTAFNNPFALNSGLSSFNSTAWSSPALLAPSLLTSPINNYGYSNSLALGANLNLLGGNSSLNMSGLLRL